METIALNETIEYLILDAEGNIMITRNEALRLMKSSSKLFHAVMVSTLMSDLAEKLDENKQEWWLVGLLHDMDYDETKNAMSKHGLIAAEKLKGRLSEYCLHAIKTHDHGAGVEPQSRLDKALIATDSLANLIERMGKTHESLTVEGLQTELNRISSNQPWFRNNILMCAEIGLDLAEFFQLCLKSLGRKDLVRKQNRRKKTG